MTDFYTTLLLIAVTIMACKSPTKLYQQGNQNEAIEASSKKLQKDPYDPEYREILKRSYGDAVKDHEDRIRALSGSANDMKYAQLHGHYQQLQALHEKIRRYPVINHFIKPLDYSGYVEAYSEKAAQINVERGMKWMEKGDKISYREAYREFKAALRFKPNDIDIKRRSEEAYEHALVNILVVPLDAYNSNYYYSSASYHIRNFQNGLIRQLNQNGSNEFVRFYTGAEGRRATTTPDEVLELRLGRLDIGQPYDQHQTRQVSKGVVVKEIVYKKDSVIKEYTQVYAKITSTKRTLLSQVEIFLVTRGADGKILSSDNLREEHRWQTELATYTGDERALTDSDKAILNRKDTMVPAPEDIANELLRKLLADLTQRLRNYYNRYR